MRQAGTENLMRDQYLLQLYLGRVSTEFVTLYNHIRSHTDSINKTGISLSISEAFMASSIISSFQRRNFIEFGSLAGFSALFILKALELGGHLTCFEKDIALANFIKNWAAHIDSVPELRGKGLTVLDGDAKVNMGTWSPNSRPDGVFIDANKSAYLDYLEWFQLRASSGHLILADNVFLGDSVWMGTSDIYSKKQIQIMKTFNEKLANDPNYDTYFVETSEGLLVAKHKN